ncbi:lysophospholipid acyltransferase family protein [Ruania halotolerans]|uniref:lysophospholipid acyltransferase family protein n=1 Tax=Ruania halotolerans TaxID=2897773 RepID=UPI001E296189|nr:lysophospholipid acyltransferase family protein [Ruania halotolerans]UFU08156.1 1-acyl-sn-glycerol-3-phosphate acyltransferase [Ruania halotolerans]
MSTDRPASAGQAITADQIKRWGPTWSRRVGWCLAHGVWNTRVVGAERMPRTGRLLVAANHTGIIDGPLLHGVIPRESHIIIKEEMFSGIIGFLMRNAGQIPVDRRNGRAALQTALTLLNEDRLVGVFPEGTRGSGDVTQTKAGIAWLAVRSGAPVLPVAILGTRPAGKKPGHIPGFRGRLTVEFGTPFQAVDPGVGVGRAAVTEAMGTIQEQLSTHVYGASERHGIPLPRSTEI